MARIGEMFSHSSASRFQRTSVRTYYSNLDISKREENNDNNKRNTNNGIRYENSYNNSMNNEEFPTRTTIIPPKEYNAIKQRVRSPSLPQIRNPNYNNLIDRHNNGIGHRLDDDTSGYTSDSIQPPLSPDTWHKENNNHQLIRQRMSKENKNYENYDRTIKAYNTQRFKHHYTSEEEKINSNIKPHEINYRTSISDLDEINYNTEYQKLVPTSKT